jgi:hypothetical protein
MKKNPPFEESELAKTIGLLVIRSNYLDYLLRWVWGLLTCVSIWVLAVRVAAPITWCERHARSRSPIEAELNLQCLSLEPVPMAAIPHIREVPHRLFLPLSGIKKGSQLVLLVRLLHYLGDCRRYPLSGTVLPNGENIYSGDPGFRALLVRRGLLLKTCRR